MSDKEVNVAGSKFQRDTQLQQSHGEENNASRTSAAWEMMKAVP